MEGEKIHASESKRRGYFSRLFVWAKEKRAISVTLDFFSHVFGDNVFGLAAETSFFLLLSVFPFVLVLLSVLSRLEINLGSDLIELLLPSSVLSFLGGIFQQTPPAANMTLFPLTLALFSASTAIWALMAGISRAFTGEPPKSPVWQRISALIFMAGFLVAVVISLGLWFYGNYLLEHFENYFYVGYVAALAAARYAVIFLWLFVFIFSLYHYTPGLRKIPARKKLPGAAFAAFFWNAASWGFEIYMNLFNNYAVLYGQVGAVLGLALWLYVIAVILLLGAEINAYLLKK